MGSGRCFRAHSAGNEPDSSRPATYTAGTAAAPASQLVGIKSCPGSRGRAPLARACERDLFTCHE